MKKMKNAKYPYTEIDGLEFPQKYQMSEYNGVDFLKIYKKSRNNIIIQIKKEITINNFPDKNQDYHNEYLKLNEGGIFETEKILWYLHNKIVKNELKLEHLVLINKFIKKFEIHKKIFDLYEYNLNTKSENFRNYKNYLILSLICAKLYEQKRNLKYLNTTLKINDLLCSNYEKISDQFDLRLLKKILQIELKDIEKLMKNNGLDLI